MTTNHPMTTRDELIDRWQTRLADAQSPARGGAPQGRWVRKVYARIYRFLLACYGNSTWTTESRDEQDGQATLTSTHLLATLKGTQPKGEPQIGKVLQAVHAANDGAESALAQGHALDVADNQSWVRTAEFKYRRLAQRAVRILRRYRIQARIFRLAGKLFIEVRRAHFDEAIGILQSHRTELSHAEFRRRLNQELTRKRAEALIVAFLFANLCALLLTAYLLAHILVLVGVPIMSAYVVIGIVFGVGFVPWCMWCTRVMRKMCRPLSNMDQ